MKKFIFLTDTHCRVNNPVSRKDNFSETILNKIEWCMAYARENNAIVLHGGDWVNRPDTSPAYVAKLCTILNKYNVPIYGIVGNHDIYGYNQATFQRTPLAIANACNAFKIIHDNETVRIEDGTCTILLTGSSSSPLIDRNGGVNEYFTPNRKTPKAVEEIRIHIVHGFLTDTHWPDSVPHTRFEQIANTDADILLTGHEHTGYGIKPFGTSVACNPGALGRVSASVGDVNRRVNICEIETTSSGKFRIKLVPLPEDIARPAEEVLDREKLEEEKETAVKLETFSQQIQQVNPTGLSISKTDTENTLEKILGQTAQDNPQFAERLRQTVHDYIGRAQALENEERTNAKSNTD